MPQTDLLTGKLARLVLLSSSLLLLHLPAHAWFFFLLPGNVTGAISDKFTGAEGDNCVGPHAKVGDLINMPGKGLATVKSLSGTSGRCQTAEFPIRALLDFNIPTTPPAHVQTEGYRCLSSTAQIGDEFVGETGARGLIKVITPDSVSCRAPTSAMGYIVFDPTAETRQEIANLASASHMPISVSADHSKPDTSAPKLPTPSGSRASDRLRALAKLLEEGLITKDDYDAKKAQILSDI
jgi:hypothetical protein